MRRKTSEATLSVLIVFEPFCGIGLAWRSHVSGVVCKLPLLDYSGVEEVMRYSLNQESLIGVLTYLERLKYLGTTWSAP
jgi:hypothetical protein